jgi:phosphoribosylamine--glycine ligase
MRVLVIGHGAREHAIAKKLAQEDLEIEAAMGRLNPGIAKLSVNVEIIDLFDPNEYEKFKGVDIAFIGPDPVLAVGITDKLLSMEIPVLGPKKALAKLEWSKAYTRKILEENGIKGNPRYKICKTKKDVNEFIRKNPEVVVKPDVLTGGKGVKVLGDHFNSLEDAEQYALQRIAMDGLVVLEEKLKGKEFTLQAFTDGHKVEIMPLVRDFKRAYNNDKGPNTGSMGSFSCSNHLMPDLPRKAIQDGIDIMHQTVQAMTQNVSEYKGVLYGGFMHTKKGVFLLEYNTRFGDPEALNVLSLLETPLTEIGFGISEGKLQKPHFSKKATVCIYLVPEGYPSNPLKEQPIKIERVENSELYYASVYDDNGIIKTTSSRAIALLGKGSSIKEAREKVYSDVSQVKGRLHYRTDIADGL